jgi:hypothetical protein
LGEAGDGGGVAGGGVEVFEGVDDEAADDDVATGDEGAGPVFVVGVGGEVLDAVEDGVGLFAAFELLEPIEVVGAVPLGDAIAAGFLGGFVVLGGAGPDEGVGVAGFEAEVGDVAVGDLGEEPLADDGVWPAVVEFAVEFFADVGGEGGEVAAGGAEGWIRVLHSV